MPTYGEKHIEHLASKNVIIQIAEWQVFDFSVKDLLDEISDYVTDDFEDFQRHNVFFDISEEYSTCEADMLAEWVDEIIKERIADDYEEEEVDWLRKWIEPLKQAEGFTLHPKWMPDWAKSTGNQSQGRTDPGTAR